MRINDLRYAERLVVDTACLDPEGRSSIGANVTVHIFLEECRSMTSIGSFLRRADLLNCVGAAPNAKL